MTWTERSETARNRFIGVVERLADGYKDNEIGLVANEFLSSLNSGEIMIDVSDVPLTAYAKRREDVGAILFLPIDYLEGYPDDIVLKKTLIALVEAIGKSRRLRGPELGEIKRMKQRLLPLLDIRASK